MARSEDGEFELILGNKQLLSVFFIVVVLLGVFFTMGYIVGKNSLPQEAMNARREPIIVDPTAPSKGPGGGTPILVEPGKPNPNGERVSPTPTRTVDPTPLPTPVPTRTPTPEPTPKQKPTPAPTAAPTPTPKPITSAGGGRVQLTNSGEPAPGQSFLQVVASSQPDCEIIADVLRKKGFSAVVVPGPTGSNLHRVLVGPLGDAAAISKARSDLEAAGFQKPYLRKY